VTAGVRVGVVLLAAAIASLDAQVPRPAPPQAQFRTSTDVVMVDVSVRAGGQPVASLRAEDFVLTDNGVRQQIESVEAAAVPIDVTLVVDLSGNPRGPWVGHVPVSKIAREVESELQAVKRILRSDDRLRVLAVDRGVQQLSPLLPVSAELRLARVEFDGLSALYDSLATALLQPVEPARRHVVIARTKGLDTISSINAQAVRAIAEQADALFHLVMMETALDSDAALSSFQCNPTLMGLCWPTKRFWVPFQRRLIGPRPVHQLLPDGEALAAAARATGGDLHRASGILEPTLAGTLRKTFEDFRSSYVLRYTPQGVSRGGWHTIAVTVPKSRSYSVRARRGYGIDEPAAPPPPAPASSAPPRTLPEFTAAYERGAYQSVLLGLRQVTDPVRIIRDFEEGGNPWPAIPGREAAFALDLVEPGVFSSRNGAQEEALRMMERFTRLIRQPFEPDVFERYWHFAALTLVEGMLRPSLADAFVTRALERFPGEPRFVLSRAIVTDQRWVAGGLRGAAGGTTSPPAPAYVESVRQQYEAAIALPETATEARIRLAWFLHGLGRHAEALDLLERAGREPVSELSLRYLRQLFLGHVLVALDRRDEAIEAYQRARSELPKAQSARVALMNAFLARGDRDEAESMAEQVQVEQSAEMDPWWMYWQGQYRLYPQAMGRLRGLIR